MSVYGPNPRYVIGAKRQVELAKEFYNGWRCRIYTDDVNNFKNVDADVIQMDCSANGVFWRFEPMFESPITITLVRDADGRITKREAMAVEEWMKSPQLFHTYRDHEAHYEFPVIACAFGLKGMLPHGSFEAMKLYMNQPFYYTNDQVYLRDCVWPLIEHTSLVHSMKEGWFGETRAMLKNRYAFCGNGWDENDLPLYPPTMEEMNGFDRFALPEWAKFDGGYFK